MKRIVTIILSVILSVTLSAQDRTPMDKIWDDIEKITSVRQYTKMKINHGDGVLRYVHNGLIGKEFLCSTDCDGVTSSFNNMTPEEIEVANERNRMRFDRIFGAIRHNLDSLMATSEESYHFESHHHGTDTIKYSLCLKNSEDSIKKINVIGRMLYPDAVETVFFDFTASPKPCGKHVRGFGTLGYNKNVYLPDRRTYYFNKEPYLEIILPILKQKDIRSWNFKWTQSADYDVDANWNKEFLSGETVGISESGGKIAHDGQTIGTMYFIPREKTELAKSVFTAIDSITLHYTEIHPEQMFRYRYHVKEDVMPFPDGNRLIGMFEGTTAKGYVSTRIFFGVSPKGYYVAIADIERNFYIPKEWSTLKSFFNGEKKYIRQK
jgi:hypothetical protein